MRRLSEIGAVDATEDDGVVSLDFTLKPVLEAHVEEHRERQVAELDEFSRLAQAALLQAAAEGKIDHAAEKLLLDIHAREAKLLGSISLTDRNVRRA